MRGLTTLLIALVPLTASCLATASDIENLKHSVSSRDEAIEDALERYEKGAITAKELDEALSAANAGLAASFDAKVDEVQERGTSALKNLPTTGNGLIDLALAAAGLVGSSVLATNRVRDKRRKKRGEPVEA